MPKVSIIIPNYNHQDFLEQRIESVLNQTYQDFELILLDDASTDNSKTIFNGYKTHPKVSHVVINEVNSGSVFMQWIKGIELSSGDFVWIAESDDYADKTFLEEAVNQIVSKERIGMVFTDTQKVDRFGNSLGLVSESKTILHKLSNIGGIINKTNVSEYLLKKMVVVNASSVLFRKSALQSLDFNVLQHFKNAGDAFVYNGLALKYDLYFLPNPLNYMRLHDSNTTKKNKKSGQIYKDKLMMLNHYLEDYSNTKVNKQDVAHFIFGILFFSIDHGFVPRLKSIVNKSHALKILSKKQFSSIQNTMFFYRFFTLKGRPQFIREYLKARLKKNILY